MRALMMDAAHEYFKVDIARHRRLSPAAAGFSIAVCFLVAVALTIFSYARWPWYTATPITLFVGTFAFIFSMLQLFLADKMSENGLIKAVLTAWDKLVQRLPGLRPKYTSTEGASDAPESRD